MDAPTTNQSEPLTPEVADPQPARFSLGFGSRLAIFGPAAVAIAAVLSLWMIPSAWVVSLVIVLVTAAVTTRLMQLDARQSRDWNAFQETVDSELAAWRERRQTLQQEAHQTTTALSRMRDGVILLNQRYEILLINPAARFLLNLAEGQPYYERPFREVVRMPELARAIDACGSGKGPQKTLVEIPHASAIRPVKVRVDRFSVSGRDNLLMTLRDETESHRVDEMRREFVANISHELKTPLAAIKGYAETVELAIKDDPDAAIYFMAQIQTQCQRLERLIADMMQLARAQSVREKLRITSISLPDVITESLKSYTPVAEAKRIDLSFDVPNTDVVVRADHEATLTIANNLIGNAIRYTPQQGKVTVACRADESTCSLIVRDTGVGIPASEQKRIFERFYRVEKGRSSPDGGTGIGLSVVKNLTVALRGQVHVTSEPGRGATFEVRLPREGSDAPPRTNDATN